MEKEGKAPVAFALADLVDNSLAATHDNAGAGLPRDITVAFVRGRTAEDSLVVVTDNGRAMNVPQLRDWCVLAPRGAARGRLTVALRRGAPRREGPVPFWRICAL